MRQSKPVRKALRGLVTHEAAGGEGRAARMPVQGLPTLRDQRSEARLFPKCLQGKLSKRKAPSHCVLDACKGTPLYRPDSVRSVSEDPSEPVHAAHLFHMLYQDPVAAYAHFQVGGSRLQASGLRVRRDRRRQFSTPVLRKESRKSTFATSCRGPKQSCRQPCHWLTSQPGGTQVRQQARPQVQQKQCA